MSDGTTWAMQPIREAMAAFDPASRIEPNEEIQQERVFYPDGHRGVLDMKRQLVVGNRGMGKSFWTHALINPDVRKRLSRYYDFPALANTKAIIGFNGSDRLSHVAPTIDELQIARDAGHDSVLIWRTVILRAVRSLQAHGPPAAFAASLDELKARPGIYAEELTAVDDENVLSRTSLLVVFDALDRFGRDWQKIRELTIGLLFTVLGLQSFRTIRAKVFMRVDQFADRELFGFPDSSKIRNDHVNLAWSPDELYGLLFFELMRKERAKQAIHALEQDLGVEDTLPNDGRLNAISPSGQRILVSAIAGEYMGSTSKRGRVFTWVPLHLGDASNNCSPRTFLTAWKAAAGNVPRPQTLAVDHLGLTEGVRRASRLRFDELREDYPWIGSALEPLRRKFVPIEKAELFALWQEKHVIEQILAAEKGSGWLAPIGMYFERSHEALLQTLVSIAVMEERANGKINVPDIFRVEANILRKGGVAVPRKN